MKIFARFTHPNAGSATDQANAKRALLRLCAIYSLASAEIGRFHSTVMLEDVQGAFNSCHFDFLDSAGCPADIYSMSELPHLCDHDFMCGNL